MNNRGFTLLELLITLAIITLLITLGVPSFSAQIHNSKVKTTTLSLQEAIALTRSQAVMANMRTTLKAEDGWENGWEIFRDSNSDGTRDPEEILLIVSREKVDSVLITANRPVKNYISFIGSGESRLDGSANGGAFQAGTLTICPVTRGKGYQLILARGGRVRTQELAAERCSQQRP